MEVYQVEDIVNLHLVEIDLQGIAGVLRGYAVDDDVLLASVQVEFIHQKAFVGIEDVRRLDVPMGVVQDGVRGQDAHMGFWLVGQVLIEADDSIQFSAHQFLVLMVVPAQRRVDIVVDGLSVEAEAHLLAIVHEFLNADHAV